MVTDDGVFWPQKHIGFDMSFYASRAIRLLAAFLRLTFISMYFLLIQA